MTTDRRTLDLWRLSHRADATGCCLADRHYNRQHIGSPQFVPPGRCVVLVAESITGNAIWVTSWPFAKYTKHQWAGAWVNSLFRNEGAGLSSQLIMQAVAATRAVFGEPPSLGIVTFVDAAKVRHKRDPGRCYLRAGWHRIGTTKSGLLAFGQYPNEMPEPQAPRGMQFRMEWH